MQLLFACTLACLTLLTSCASDTGRRQTNSAQSYNGAAELLTYLRDNRLPWRSGDGSTLGTSRLSRHFGAIAINRTASIDKDEKTLLVVVEGSIHMDGAGALALLRMNGEKVDFLDGVVLSVGEYFHNAAGDGCLKQTFTLTDGMGGYGLTYECQTNLSKNDNSFESLWAPIRGRLVRVKSHEFNWHARYAPSYYQSLEDSDDFN